MKNNKGFSLIEVMAALVVFTFVAAAVMPMLVHVYKERLSIHEEQQAMKILENRMQLWQANGDTPKANDTIHRLNTSYHFTWDLDDESQSVTSCISWMASNERGYKKCSHAKIPMDSP